MTDKISNSILHNEYIVPPRSRPPAGNNLGALHHMLQNTVCAPEDGQKIARKMLTWLEYQ